jgi:hypothetical protein
MKGKLVIWGSLVVCCTLLPSCRKNYICNCTNGASLPVDNAIKTDATAACAEYQDIVRLGSPAASCKLDAN